MKAVVAAFNQEKALVGAFSVITNLRMELFEALAGTRDPLRGGEAAGDRGPGPASQQGKSSAVESTRAPGSGRGELGPEKMVKS